MLHQFILRIREIKNKNQLFIKLHIN